VDAQLYVNLQHTSGTSKCLYLCISLLQKVYF